MQPLTPTALKHFGPLKGGWGGSRAGVLHTPTYISPPPPLSKHHYPVRPSFLEPSTFYSSFTWVPPEAQAVHWGHGRWCCCWPLAPWRQVHQQQI